MSLAFFGGEVFMLKMNYVKFENICIKFKGSSNPSKVYPRSILTNCHNSRMTCPETVAE